MTGGAAAGGWRLLKAGEVEEEEEEDEGCGKTNAAPELQGPVQACKAWRSLTLLVILIVFVANQACRILPFYLVNFSEGATPEGAMNVALGFLSGRYGFFATMGFTIPFTLGSLVAGVVADKADRMQLIGVAGIVWSCCTLFMAGAGSYSVLLGLRLLLGLAQSVMNPAAISLIAELFPEARATMTSIFGTGIYFGGGLASLGAEVDKHLGWRSACALFGLASMVASLLAFLRADPREPWDTSGASGQPGSAQGGASFAERSSLFRIAPAVKHAVMGCPSATGNVVKRTAEATSSKVTRWMLLASTLRFCAGFGKLVWLPPAMHTRFPDRDEDFSVYNSMIKVVVGSASSLAGGLASDALKKLGLGETGGAVFCVASSLLSAPLWHFVLSEGLSFEAAMAFLLAEYLMAESWLGPAVATLQGAVPVDHRGAAQGVFSSLTALGNVLPAFLGLLATGDLARGLQVSVTACYVAASACFAAAAVCLQQQQQQQRVESEPPFLAA